MHPSDAIPPRHISILKHIGLYRLMLRESLVALMLRGNATPTSEEQADAKSRAGVALNRLVKDGFVNHHRSRCNEWPPLGRDVPFFTLTPEGAALANVPIERAEKLGTPFKESALETHLAALWFSAFGRRPAHRAEPDELRPFLGAHKSFENVPHCLVRDADGLRLYRIYPPSTDLRQVMKHLRRQLADLQSRRVVQTWRSERDYGFAVLAPTAQFCRDIQQQLVASRLNQEAHFTVALAPTIPTLRTALRKLSEENL